LLRWLFCGSVCLPSGDVSGQYHAIITRNIGTHSIEKTDGHTRKNVSASRVSACSFREFLFSLVGRQRERPLQGRLLPRRIWQYRTNVGSLRGKNTLPFSVSNHAYEKQCSLYGRSRQTGSWHEHAVWDSLRVIARCENTRIPTSNMS
jgi:hypothetical protein